MVRSISAFAVLLLFASHAIAERQRVPDPNLVAVYQGIKKSLENRRVDGLTPDASLFWQAKEVLSGPSDPTVQLDDGSIFYSACRQDSCDEKGAVILDGRTRQPLALAILHFRCHRQASSGSVKVSCDRDATFDTYVFDGAIKQQSASLPTHLQPLEDWARQFGYANRHVVHVRKAR
ncbi:MAG: hypothetical protein K2X55_00330 [Burkholderiaceae bacterium]|nr:hypothetical protein [Burkholderiaceae bacterium]